jgi:DNA-binding NtrC family response regulator
MPVETQVKLLRVLEEQRFRRLGGKREIQVDVRVLAATNQNLDAAIAENRFRQDLYYRLCVVTLHMPALRERPDDIPLLAQHFINRFSQQNHKSIHTLTPAAQDILMRYSWPGNVRELRNVIERAVIFCTGPVIDRSHLPDTLTPPTASPHGLKLPVGLSLKEAEHQLIHATLRANNHNKTRTARILGISLKTLYNKLHQDRNT